MNSQIDLDFDRVGSASGLRARDAWRRFNKIQKNLTGSSIDVETPARGGVASDENRMVLVDGDYGTRFQEDAVRNQSVHTQRSVFGESHSWIPSRNESVSSGDSIQAHFPTSIHEDQSAQAEDLLPQIVEAIGVHEVQSFRINAAIQRQQADDISQSSTLVEHMTARAERGFQRHLRYTMGARTKTGLHLRNRYRMWRHRKADPVAWAAYESRVRTQYEEGFADFFAEHNRERANDA